MIPEASSMMGNSVLGGARPSARSAGCGQRGAEEAPLSHPRTARPTRRVPASNAAAAHLCLALHRFAQRGQRAVAHRHFGKHRQAAVPHLHSGRLQPRAAAGGQAAGQCRGFPAGHQVRQAQVSAGWAGGQAGRRAGGQARLSPPTAPGAAPLAPAAACCPPGRAAACVP